MIISSKPSISNLVPNRVNSIRISSNNLPIRSAFKDAITEIEVAPIRLILMVENLPISGSVSLDIDSPLFGASQDYCSISELCASFGISFGSENFCTPQ